MSSTPTRSCKSLSPIRCPPAPRKVPNVSSLAQAIKSSDSQTIARLSNGGLDVNTPLFWSGHSPDDSQFLVPLVLAAKLNPNAQVIAALLAAGAEPNSVNKFSQTALHVICLWKSTSSLQKVSRNVDFEQKEQVSTPVSTPVASSVADDGDDDDDNLELFAGVQRRKFKQAELMSSVSTPSALPFLAFSAAETPVKQQSLKARKRQKALTVPDDSNDVSNFQKCVSLKPRASHAVSTQVDLCTAEKIGSSEVCGNLFGKSVSEVVLQDCPSTPPRNPKRRCSDAPIATVHDLPFGPPAFEERELVASVELLLGADVNVRTTDMFGRSAFDYAVQNCHQKIASILRGRL
eukprot:CAMPEP_0113845274 /NCGR_PEP_ID=MMETSP0372-20130328/665_1 /TAXON_ID=340204 /ORGANISM="Lankesteria abbotti" /LENGTH=347 /DNA_ID=CAMNT_0000814297 /DNA_START=15 /DNA_END=1058 /DNA_ORIENTATION=+ /assembly_acc=CAM_ASM_000359